MTSSELPLLSRKPPPGWGSRKLEFPWGCAAWRPSGRSRCPRFLQCGGEEAAARDSPESRDLLDPLPGARRSPTGRALLPRAAGGALKAAGSRVQVPGGVARQRRLLAFQVPQSPPRSDGSPMTLPPVPPHRPRARRWRPLRALECVLLGDGAVGKTSLALSYSTNGFPARYVPTALDRFSGTVAADPPRGGRCPRPAPRAQAGGWRRARVRRSRGPRGRPGQERLSAASAARPPLLAGGPPRSVG